MFAENMFLRVWTRRVLARDPGQEPKPAAHRFMRCREKQQGDFFSLNAMVRGLIPTMQGKTEPR